MKLEDVKVGETYTVRMLGRTITVTIRHIDHERKEFGTSFGPVPFSSVTLMAQRKTPDAA
jgi:hypothetical protein